MCLSVCLSVCLCLSLAVCLSVCVRVSPDTRPIEEAGEASESCTGPSGRSKGPRGAYTEHIFADPLGAQKTDLPVGYTQRYADARASLALQRRSASPPR